MEPNNEPHDDTSVPLEPAARANNDEWLTMFLVLICRAFLTVIIAFAKAILVVACDAEAGTVAFAHQESFNKVCSSLMNGIYNIREGLAQHSTGLNPQELDTRSSTERANQIGRTQEVVPVFSRPLGRDSAEPRCYVITTGLDVGITAIREVATNLTSGVHNNVQHLCNTRAEAISFYLSSLEAGNVRRVCIHTSKSGQTEATIEVLPRDGEVPDLDQRLAISASSILKDLSEPSHGFVSNTGADTISLSSSYVFDPSVTAKSEYDSDGLMMPSEWNYTCPANTPNASPLVHSRTETLRPLIFTGPLRSYTLDSDEDSSSTSRGDVSEPGINDEEDAQSTHSSDIYYSSSLELAIAEHIRQDEEALGIINAFDVASA